MSTILTSATDVATRSHEFARARVVDVEFDVCDYTSVVDWLKARQSDDGRARYVCVSNVTDVMDARRDSSYSEALGGSSLTVPDGAPIVWAMRDYGYEIRERVYGPTLMQTALEDSSLADARHVLIAGSEQARAGVRQKFDGVRWVGELDFHFDSMGDAEFTELAERFNELDCDFAWISLGGGKQVRFMHRFAPLIGKGTLIGVGAAFDFHAGLIAQAQHGCSETVWSGSFDCRQNHAGFGIGISYITRLTFGIGFAKEVACGNAAKIRHIAVTPSCNSKHVMSTLIAKPTPYFDADVRAADEAKSRRAIIVLPAYNEEESLPALLEAIELELASAAFDYTILVVDDGSSDDTARIASQASFRMPLHLVQHAANSGLAAAIRTGFEQAAKLAGPEDVIFTMDADNTHPPGLMHRMFAAVCEGHDVVIASRFRAGSRIKGVPLHRNLMSFGARALFQVAFPIRGVRDYTCGYRAYKSAVVRKALREFGDSFVSETGFSCMVDVLLKLRGQRLVMGEVPMVLRYDQKGGGSKMRVAKTALQTLSLIVRRRFGGTGAPS